MKTLIMALNRKSAEYIQKGLGYENMSCETSQTVIDSMEIERLCLSNDGIYIYHEKTMKLYELIAAITKVKPDMPVIILSSEYEQMFEDLKENKKIVNYFIRPFPFRQMATEMKFAVFDVKEKLDVCKYVLRDLEMDIVSHQVRVAEEPVYLRNKEFMLLQYMMINRGRVLSRNDIIENVWDRNTDMLTNTVDVHISKLRKKIETKGKGKFIRTVPCLGYILE